VAGGGLNRQPREIDKQSERPAGAAALPAVTMDKKSVTLDSPTITIKAAATCIPQGLPEKIN
jgi:hypothetical protein